MFDPSKLNLDLDNLDNNDNQENTNSKNQKEPQQEIKKEEKSENTNQNTNKKDILDFKNENSKAEQEEKQEIKQEESNNSENDTQKIEENKKEETKPVEEKNEIKKEEENKIIFDINLISVEKFILYLMTNKYDFFTIEPEENNVKINFFKEKVLKETKYIKYPIYSKILINLKSLTKLKIDETEKTQEGKGEIILKNKTLKVISKTVPTNYGEKIFIKATETIKKTYKKEHKKTSLSTILGFLGAIIFIALILIGAFISFVVMHAQTVEDVKFFYRLGINLNDINNFIETTVSIVFSIILLFEIITLIIFIFKFLFTKKEYKRKKITRGLISITILLIAFFTTSVWMYLDKKIRALPNWQELAYGNIQILDNNLFNKPNIFNKEESLLKETNNIIGPIDIRFDLTNFTKNELKKGIKIKEYNWIINSKTEIKTLDPILIHNFNKIGTYKIDLYLKEVNIHGDIIDKKVKNIPSIEISNIIKINEEKLNNGGKIVKFDALDLKNLGKIDWYFITDINKDIKPVFTGYKFNPAKVIFEDTIIGLKIRKPDNNNDKLDKVFVIEATKEDINANIEIKQDIINDFLYTFKVKNINTEFGNGFVEKFKWTIDEKMTKNLNADANNLEKSSTIRIKFNKYGKHLIKIELIDSNGNKKIIEKQFEIKKRIKLKKGLKFYHNNIELKTEYKNDTNEYFIKYLKVPTKIEISAKEVESNNILNYLKKIEWDVNGDGNIEEIGKTFKYFIPTEGTYKIDVYYTFQNKRIKNKINKLKETIYIDAEKKEAILNLKINKPRDYVPVKVSFDASNSYVKGKDISKFIFDYGDGTPQDLRDAQNRGHLYTEPGDYIVKLTVVTTDGKKYYIEKKLVLKPEPQKAEITVSMKKAPIYTPIDFSSSKSSGEIISYFWDFGDGKTSTEANPSHMYKKAGIYIIKLTLDFKNKNSLTDILKIQIVNE